jgi:hypothetical protein
MEGVLLAPILNALLSLLISLLAMHQEQTDKRSSHAAKDSQRNDNVDPDTKMVGGGCSNSADATAETVPRVTLFIGSAGFTNELACHTNIRSRITVETNTTVSPRYNVNKFTVNAIRCIRGILDNTSSS